MSEARHREATDEELVRQFRAGRGRDAAFMALFERWGPVTLAFLRRRVGDPALAEELNQDVYLGVLKGLAAFRGESTFKTWLFRMAQNRLHNLRRRLRTHLDELPDASSEDLERDLFEADAPAPDEQAARGRSTRALRRCLAALPELERAVVIGQYYMKVTLAELTRNLDMDNPSGARAALIAAQRKLRRCLEQAGVDTVSAGGWR